MTTIVSCFLANSNNRGDRKTDKYVDYGKKLLNVNNPKIIFIDDSLIDLLINSKEYNKENTLLIPINKNDIYLYEYQNHITDFNIITDFPNKDTLEYMFIICSKTEFMKKAIEINAFNTEQFLWIDFGINHMLKYDDKEFEEKIINLTTLEYYNVRISSIKDPNIENLDKDIYRQVVWYLAGTVFGGLNESLIKFADLVKEKCLEIIFDKGSLMWEVNIWYLVLLENKDLFDTYSCDHDRSVITNY